MINTKQEPHARVLSVTAILFALLMSMMSCERHNASDSPDIPTITVFAAASLTDAVTTLANQFRADTGIDVTCSFASSSTLARQIQAGAGCDIYISASSEWMDEVENDGLMDATSRTDLISNTLVLISPVNQIFHYDAHSDLRLEDAFEGRLAVGDPDHVPAGIYAKQALTALGSWDALAGRVVFAGDVRSVLMFVERGEVAAGIVYATDARISDRIAIVAELPANLHEPIVYPAALTTGASESPHRFFNYLRSDDAAAVFRKAGFVIRSPSP